VLEALLRVLLLGRSDRELLLAIGEIMEDTARFSLPGVRLKEKALPTYKLFMFKFKQ
jgi:hypothetical protein